MTTEHHKRPIGRSAGCLTRIKTLYPQLTVKEQKVADFVFSQTENVIYISITEMVSLSKAGYGTIIRFCRRLGYSGFQDFKINLTKDLALDQASQENTGPVSYAEAIANRSITDIRNTLKLLSLEHIDHAAKMLSEAHMVLAMGCGGSAISAKEIE